MARETPSVAPPSLFIHDLDIVSQPEKRAMVAEILVLPREKDFIIPGFVKTEVGRQSLL